MSLSSSVLHEFQDQVKLLPIDDSNLRLFKVEISPQTGVYAHAVFLFMVPMEQCIILFNKINVPDSYPNNPPIVSCLTPVFHPNINPLKHFDNVCFNLTEHWSRGFGLKSLLHALLFLFYEPNFEDPVIGFIPSLSKGALFEHYVRQSLMGGTINSVTYEANQVWCRWAEESGLLISLSEEWGQVRFNFFCQLVNRLAVSDTHRATKSHADAVHIIDTSATSLILSRSCSGRVRITV
ncbi:hypothetical protein P879_10875 [Paragonimus westermani]|uniref:UBC core domain-containing protein n=1 Tax=Paragonimus westermani TaxID=34504 RepID=A0A8T0DCD2_9TREM|nr:hypothetical protein P879_10875 [Paragonimus westermani]